MRGGVMTVAIARMVAVVICFMTVVGVSFGVVVVGVLAGRFFLLRLVSGSA